MNVGVSVIRARQCKRMVAEGLSPLARSGTMSTNAGPRPSWEVDSKVWSPGVCRMRMLRWPALLCLALLPACATDGDDAPGLSVDAIAPAAITDLVVVDDSSHSVLLAWTAPGDDGMEGAAARYDIRCSLDAFAEDWDAAMVVDSTLIPRAAGERESLQVREWNDGAWTFAVKAGDEAANWAQISNPASITLLDTIPPARAADLTAVMVTATSVKLEWTAPGDDGAWGRAAAYDLRYAREPITADSWDRAVRVADPLAPEASGSRESCTLTILDPATSYWFALKIADNAGLESPLSNVVARTTAAEVRLTYSVYCPYGCGSHNPAWSPDGEHIGFIESSLDGRDVRVTDLEGGGSTRLTPEHSWVSAFCWSPDGTRILYATPVGDLFVLDAVPNRTPVLLASAYWWEDVIACAWSPDGDRIAYSVAIYSEGYDVGGNIYVLDLAGGSARRVFHDTASNRGLQWSPDGTRLLFGSRRAGTLDLWTVPASGGAPMRVTDDPGHEYDPSWSRDGRIAFITTRDDASGVWMMNSAGEEDFIRLTGGQAMQPSFSPDGKAIAFCRWQDDMREIWVVRWER